VAQQRGLGSHGGPPRLQGESSGGGEHQGSVAARARVSHAGRAREGRKKKWSARVSSSGGIRVFEDDGGRRRSVASILARRSKEALTASCS
jgi:hypothetical protein